MLPVLIYDPSAAVRNDVLNALRSVRSQSVELRIVNSTDSAFEIDRYLQDESAVSLLILGLTRNSPGNHAQCFDLAHTCMNRNRNNYTLFFLHDPAALSDLLCNCMRPAGILLPPFDPSAFRNSIARIIDDYSSLSGNNLQQSHLVLETNSTTYQIPYSQIVYLESLDKKLNLVTNRQILTVRKTLGSLIEQLPERFLHCHRSYVVNWDYVEQADFSNMLLTLTTGDTIPIARSSRAAIKQYWDQHRLSGASVTVSERM